MDLKPDHPLALLFTGFVIFPAIAFVLMAPFILLERIGGPISGSSPVEYKPTPYSRFE